MTGRGSVRSTGILLEEVNDETFPSLAETGVHAVSPPFGPNLAEIKSKYGRGSGYVARCTL